MMAVPDRHYKKSKTLLYIQVKFERYSILDSLTDDLGVI